MRNSSLTVSSGRSLKSVPKGFSTSTLMVSKPSNSAKYNASHRHLSLFKQSRQEATQAISQYRNKAGQGFRIQVLTVVWYIKFDIDLMAFSNKKRYLEPYITSNQQQKSFRLPEDHNLKAMPLSIIKTWKIWWLLVSHFLEIQPSFAPKGPLWQGWRKEERCILYINYVLHVCLYTRRANSYIRKT